MPTGSEHALAFAVDGLRLAGVLHLPPGQPRAAIIGSHGLMADKHSPKQIDLASRCTAQGMAYLRFDHRGCGESQGRFDRDTTLENRRTDLLAAVQAVVQALGRKLPIGLFGSSLGGTVCLSTVGLLHPFAVVTLAAPVQHRAIHLPADSPASLTQNLVAPGIHFDIAALLGAVHHLLVLHGDQDETVPVENAQTIFRLAADPKRCVILPGADHRISRPDHRATVIQAAADWFMHCLMDNV